MEKQYTNRCETFNICILGDITKHLKCRKENCPKKTMADIPSPMLPIINHDIGKILSKSNLTGKK